MAAVLPCGTTEQGGEKQNIVKKKKFIILDFFNIYFVNLFKYKNLVNIEKCYCLVLYILYIQYNVDLVWNNWKKTLNIIQVK